MADDSELATAERVERQARRLIDRGHGTDALKVALDQLVADRTNGERLGASIERLRTVVADIGEHPTTEGEAP